MHTILVMARLTLQEAVRRRMVLAALVLGLLFLVVYDLGFYFINQEFAAEVGDLGGRAAAARGEANNFLLLAGLYVVNFLGVVTAALISADSLAGEITSGTIQAVVTKPIQRAGVVLGKWLGHAALLALYLGMMAGGVVLSLRILGDYHAPNWLAGVGLIYLNSVIIMTLTMAASSMFSTLATGGAVFGAFGVAFIGGWVERIGSFMRNQTAIDLGIVSSLLLPSEALWNKAANLMTSPLSILVGQTPFTSVSQPSPLMLAYSAVYLCAMLWLAVRQFGRRDL